MSVCEEAPLMEGLVVGSVKNVGDAIWCVLTVSPMLHLRGHVSISAEGHESWLYRYVYKHLAGLPICAIPWLLAGWTTGEVPSLWWCIATAQIGTAIINLWLEP